VPEGVTVATASSGTDAAVLVRHGDVDRVGLRRAVQVAPGDGTAEGARRAVVAGAVAPRDGPPQGASVAPPGSANAALSEKLVPSGTAASDPAFTAGATLAIVTVAVAGALASPRATDHGTACESGKTYATNGTYTATLVVTDALGLASAPATATVTIATSRPAVNAGSDAAVPLGTSFSLQRGVRGSGPPRPTPPAA